MSGAPSPPSTPATPPAPSAPSTSSTLPADYFDGVSARARRVGLRLQARTLLVEGDGVMLRVPLAAVRWPERTRHGARVAHLQGGGSLQALDTGAWDAWARADGIGESAIVTAQQSWRGVGVAVVLLALLAGAGYVWGVPWAARAVLAVLPASVDRAVGDAVLRSLDGELLRPSAVPAARQQQIRATFDAALARAAAANAPRATATPHTLRFHASPTVGQGPGARSRLGPNAFALPGGTIVVTDEMLQLLEGRDDILLGVLGHELGHAQRRHGLRLLVQATLIATAASVALGDFSSVLAAAPALLGQSGYSRDFEREADGDAIALLRAAGIPPAVMAELFERLAARRAGESAARPAPGRFDLGIALASHPADAERIRRFRETASR